MREQTEWTELVENGFASIAASNKAQIVSQAKYFMNNGFTGAASLYGDGNAGEKIAAILKNHLN